MAQGSLRAKKLQQWAREKEETDEWFPFGKASSTRKSSGGGGPNSSNGSHVINTTPNGSLYSPAQDQRNLPRNSGGAVSYEPSPNGGFQQQQQFFMQSPTDNRFYSMSNLQNQPMQPTPNFHLANNSQIQGNTQAAFPTGTLASTPEISSVQPQATYYYPSNVPYPTQQSPMGVMQQHPVNQNLFISPIGGQSSQPSQPQFILMQPANQPFYGSQPLLPAIQQSRGQPDLNLNDAVKPAFYPASNLGYQQQQQPDPLMVPGGMTYTEQWANQLTTWAQDQRSDGCLSPRTVPTNNPSVAHYATGGPHGPPGFISASQSEAGGPVHRPSHYHQPPQHLLMQTVPEANSASQTSIPKAVVAPTGYPQNGLVSQRLAIVSPMNNDAILAVPPSEHPMRRRLDSVGMPFSSDSVGDDDFNTPAQQGLLNASMTASYPGSGFSRTLSIHRRRRTVTGSRDEQEMEEEQLKKLEQKALFDQQIADKQRQKEVEEMQQRMEDEVKAKEREMVEQRERMQAETELTRWRTLDEAEKKKSQAVQQAFAKADAEAKEIRRKRIFKHAYEGGDAKSEISRRSSQDVPDDSSSTTTRGLFNDIVSVERLPFGNETESNIVSPPASVHSSSQSPTKQLTDRSKSLPPIIRGSVSVPPTPEDDRPIRPQHLNPLELWEQIKGSEPTVEPSASTSASSGETKSDRDSSDVIRRRPIVRQSMRVAKSKAVDAAVSQRRAHSGERESHSATDEPTSVRLPSKSRIPTHTSTPSHIKPLMTKLETNGVSVPSESTKPQRKISPPVNGKGIEAKLKKTKSGQSPVGSTRKPGSEEEEFGSDISVESDVQRMIDRQSKHVRQPSAGTYTIPLKLMSKAEVTKKTKDNNVDTAKPSSSPTATPTVKKPSANGHSGDSAGKSTKEKTRKLKKSPAELLSNLLAIEPEVKPRPSASDGFSKHPQSTAALDGGELANGDKSSLQTLCGNDPLYVPIMTRQKKRGMKASSVDLQSGVTPSHPAEETAANSTTTSIDQYQSKVPLHDSISLRRSVRTNGDNQRLLDQLSALREQLKTKQKAVESAFTGASR